MVPDDELGVLQHTEAVDLDLKVVGLLQTMEDLDLVVAQQFAYPDDM